MNDLVSIIINCYNGKTFIKMFTECNRSKL